MDIIVSLVFLAFAGTSWPIAPLMPHAEPSSCAPKPSNHGSTSVSLIEYG